jgi:Transposase DDE domain
MTISLHGLATTLQTLLTDVATTAAKESKFIRRVRKITGAGFVQSLVLGWLADPDAKHDDLAATLGVTTQSFQERLTDKAADCLQRVLTTAMGYLFGARPETIPLLRRFTEVDLEDSTTVTLPASLAEEFPGCGGSDPEAGQAGAKIMTRLEAITGRVEFCAPVAASTSDRTLHKELPTPPLGTLRLADLGFFDLERMAQDTERGIFWISRVPAKLLVRSGNEPGVNVTEWLRRQKSDRIDAIVTVGTKHRLTCRLVAVRTPPEVAKQRLKRLEKKLKKKGRKLSEAQRMLCEWTVVLTNLRDAERFTAEELWVLYGVRWQIELMFKRWKSHGGLARSRARTGPTALCELLAKLLAVIIKHWATLLRGGPLNAVSAARAGSRVKYSAPLMAEALERGFEKVVAVLERLKADLDRLPKRARRKRPTTRQRLFAPCFAASAD